MHKARKRRGTPMHAPVQERLSRKERHIAAAISLAEVDAGDDLEWQLAIDRFRKTAENFVLELLGRRGGKARSSKLSAEQRSEIAKLGSQTRWKKLSQQ